MEEIKKKLPHLRDVNQKLNLDEFKNAKFYIIKSFNEENIFKAIKYNVWCSTIAINNLLNQEFLEANNMYPIVLFFSGNKTGYFQGIAKMTSLVDFK